MAPRLTLARPADVPEIVALRSAAAARLTREFGPGHWSRPSTAANEREGMRRGHTYVLREGTRIVAALRLVPRKPPEHRQWFTDCRRPLYLPGMAVAADCQRRGIGRRCLEDVVRLAREWPADAIRLDAYDAPAGAGPFYERCGFREAGRRLFFGAPIIYYEMML